MPCVGGCASVGPDPLAESRAQAERLQTDLKKIQKQLNETTQLLCALTQNENIRRAKVPGLKKWTEEHVRRDLRRVKDELLNALTKVLKDDKDNRALFTNPSVAIDAGVMAVLKYYKDPRDR